MRKAFVNLLIAVIVCLGFLFLTSYGFAADESEQEVTQELISGLDVTADTADYLVSGPGTTFGERLQDAVNNGTITKEQYNTIVNRFLALPDEKRWAIKGGFDRGKGIPTSILHPGGPDDATIQDHIADLKSQGYTRPQIMKALRDQGVSEGHIKDLVYGSVSEGVQNAEGITQDLIESGVNPEVVDDLFGGSTDPVTLGIRVQDMLEAGTITQKQYDIISNQFLSLPDERRWAIKNAYDKGYTEKVYNQLTGMVHERLNPPSVRDHIKDLLEQGVPPDKIKDKLVAAGMDPAMFSNILASETEDASLRDHAKDLRQQGLTKEEIKNRLINEGIDPAKVENLIAGEASRREHARDLREEGLSREQAKERARETVEPSHAKDKRDELKGVDRRGHARDVEHERAKAREHTKDRKDIRREPEIRERRGRDLGGRSIDRGAARERRGR